MSCQRVLVWWQIYESVKFERKTDRGYCQSVTVWLALQVDIEGFEPFAIKSAAALLQNFKV